MPLPPTPWMAPSLFGGVIPAPVEPVDALALAATELERRAKLLMRPYRAPMPSHPKRGLRELYRDRTRTRTPLQINELWFMVAVRF